MTRTSEGQWIVQNQKLLHLRDLVLGVELVETMSAGEAGEAVGVNMLEQLVMHKCLAGAANSDTLELAVIVSICYR